MKQFFVFSILLLLISCSHFGQVEKDYSYKYRLSITDTLKASSVSINPFETKSETAQFSGRLINSLLLPVIYASVNVKGKDTSFIFFTDDKGKFSYPLLPGEYTLTVSSLQYTSTSFQLIWKGSQGFEYLINLGRKPRGGIYNVHSKTKLDQPSLEEIKDCLWRNLSNPGSCGKANIYFVSGEL